MSENEDRVTAASSGPSALRRVLRAVGTVLVWLGAAIGAVLIGTALWVQRMFGNISIDQMFMHLPGAGGAETTGAESEYLQSFVVQALVLPLGAVLVACGAWILLRRLLERARRRSASADAPEAAVVPVRRRVLTIAPAFLATAALIAGGSMVWQAFSLTEYQESVLSQMDMADYYVVPSTGGDVASASSEQKGAAESRNLVLIYLESADAAFADEERFEQNLYASLNRATAGWASIPSLRTYEGGGWTMAGLVGTQCGIPLRGSGLGADDINSNEIGAGQDGYLTSAVCLGDALDAAGYTSVFLGGADAQFASKVDFLTDHGYDEVKDLPYWQESGETEFSGWGLSDRALMEQAKAEVTRLHDSGAPFNLTMLTLDFHEPLHVYDSCPVITEEPLGSVLRCSTDQVAGFVDYMEQMGYLEDTTVVIMGDHPKMVAQDGAYSSEFAGIKQRDRVLYNRIWSPDGASLARDDLDQLSLYATILDLLDLGRDDHRAGLGVSASVDPPPGSPLADLSAEQYGELLRSRSGDFYREMWGLEESKTVVAGAGHE